jgi:hypothetical protein
MTGTYSDIKSTTINKHLPVLNTRDCYTCSFKEFLPFNAEMYYYSTFKAFGTIISAR